MRRGIDHALMEIRIVRQFLVGIDALGNPLERTRRQCAFVGRCDRLVCKAEGIGSGTNVGVSLSASEIRSSCSAPLSTR